MVQDLVNAEARIRPPAIASDAKRRRRLLLMAHFIYTNRVGGAEQAFYNLVRGIGCQDTDVNVVCGTRDRFDRAALAEFDVLPAVRVIEAGGTHSRFLAEQLACLRGDLSADAVLFPNYYVPPYVPRRLGRVAVVIYDLQYQHLPQYCSLRRRSWLRLAQAYAVRRADTVITTSRFVANDVARNFGSGVGTKMTVIPIAVFWDRFGGADLPSPLDRPYILSVAAHYPHKNLVTLIHAFALLAPRNRDLMLVLCGQDYRALRGTRGGACTLRQSLDSLGLAGRVRVTGYISDAELGRWYCNAALFAFPSVFEGFGLPPVEALGLGLPTLTTRCTAIPEVTLGLAQYVDDPYSAGEWAARMEMMLRDTQAFRPGEMAARRVRAHYDVERLGRLYLNACGA